MAYIITIVTSCSVREIRDDAVVYADKDGTEIILPADTVHNPELVELYVNDEVDKNADSAKMSHKSLIIRFSPDIMQVDKNADSAFLDHKSKRR